MKSEGAALAVRGLTKIFPSPAGELTVLDNLQLQIPRGEMVAVVGPSGVGKSTLLYLLAGLDRPSSGEVFFQEKALGELSPEQLAEFRNRHIGFVWQLSNLLPDFTARENVMMPLLVRGEGRPAASRAAGEWLAEVGLAERTEHLAGELSGGEQQRTALARALVTQPEVLFADEPTGNLDETTSEQILALLQRLHRSHGLTSLIATHNLNAAGQCDRIWRLHDGQLIPAEQHQDSKQGQRGVET